MSQNILDLSFDIDKFDAHKKLVYEGLVQVYEMGQKIGENLIPLGSGGGWTELITKVKAVERAVEDLQNANVKAAQSIGLTTKVTDEAAAATDKLVTADRKQESSKQALEKTKQAGLKTDQETVKLITLEEKAEQESLKTKKQKGSTDQANEKIKQQKLKTDQETVKLIKEEEKAEQEQIKTKKQKLSFEQALQKEKAKGLSDAAAEMKIAAQLTDEYAILSKSLKEQEIRYKNLALVKGFEAEATQEALQEALNTRNVLDKLDQNLRNHQRNVGNYKSAFDGLGMSFSQVARELPSLTISTQQFMLAISNNLPMVFDEISKAKTEINAMKAAGEETPSLFSRIAKSVFSLQVGLSLLVLAFTIFGSKIIDVISSLFDASAAMEKAAEATARLQKAQLELIKTQEELNKLLADPINDIDRLDKTLAIYQALGRSRGDTLAIEKKILDIKALEANQEFMKVQDNGLSGFTALEDYKAKFSIVSTELNGLLKVQAENVDYMGREFDKKAQENLQKVIDRKKIEFELTKKQFLDQKKIVEDNFQYTQVELPAKSLEIARYNAEQKVLIETESAKIKAEVAISQNQRILSDERNFEKERNQALINSAAERKKIIAADLEKVTSDPANRNLDDKGNFVSYTAEAQAAIKKAAADELEVDKQLEVDKFKNHEDFRKRRLAAELEIGKAEVSYAANKYKQLAELDSNSFTVRMEAYAEYYRSEQVLIRQDYDFQIATKVLTTEELIALETNTQKKLKELADNGRQEISAIYISNGNELLAQAESIDKNKLSIDELALYRSLKNKKKFTEEANKMELQQQKATLQNDIYTQNEIIASALTTEDAKKKAAQRILDNQTKLNQLELNEEQKKEAAKASIKDIYYQLELKGVETFFSLAQKLSDAYYAKRFEDIANERKLLDENHAKEVENIRNSTISAQEKAAQITMLNAQQAAKKSQLDQKERNEKRKHAETDKAINISKIIVETALAVVHQLGSGDPYTAYARAALVGAAGAAELAIAIAAPIPNYAEGAGVNGKAAHPGGPAVVGEKKVAGGYQPEMVEQPDGKIYTVTKPTLIPDMPAGTKVVPLTTLNKNSVPMYGDGIGPVKLGATQSTVYDFAVSSSNISINEMLDNISSAEVDKTEQTNAAREFIINKAMLANNLPVSSKLVPFTAKNINDAAYGSMVQSMTERLVLVEHAEALKNSNKILKEIKTAINDQGAMYAQVMQKQKHVTNVNVHVSSAFDSYIQNTIAK